MAIEKFYRHLFHSVFTCQILVVTAYVFSNIDIPFSILGLFPVLATLAVLSKEISFYRELNLRVISLFCLHYGLYSLIVFLLSRRVFDEAVLAQILKVFKAQLVDAPLSTLVVVVVSFAVSDYATWLIHYLFHKARGRLTSIFLSSHLVHHSMDQMRLLSIRHNGFSVLITTLPTCIALGILENFHGGLWAAVIVALLIQIAFNAVLTPFQHADFTSELATRLYIPVGNFHLVHHNDAYGGSHSNFSVGVLGLWDVIMGTCRPGSFRRDTLPHLKPQFGKIGFRFSGWGDHLVQAFLISQLRPFVALKKVFRK